MLTLTRPSIEKLLARQSEKWAEFLAENLGLSLFVYFALGVLVRYGISPHIGWFDEAEVAISTTQWQWFYHPTNPPLYHWLLLGMYKIFGIQPLSHFILKNILMVLTIFSLYQVALRMVGDKVLALCLGLSPLFIKDWGIWGSFKFTHSNLLICTMAVTFWQWSRWMEHPTHGNALRWGGAMALGCLAKYNYIFFMLPFFGALLVVDEIRKRVTIALLVLILLPSCILGGIHTWYALEIHQHYDLSALVARKFRGQAYPCLVMTVLNQGRLVLTQIMEQTFPLNLALLLIGLEGRKQMQSPSSVMGKFFLWHQILALVTLGGMILGFGLTSQPKRYILPFIMGIPFVVFACLPQLISWRRSIALLFSLLFIVREIWIMGLMIAFSRESLPQQDSIMLPQGDYQALAQVIAQQDKAILITDDLMAAGNLRFYLPQMTIYKKGYNDFWLTPKEGKTYNQSQMVYLWAKKQSSGKIDPTTAIKHVSLPLKGGQVKEYELMTIK